MKGTVEVEVVACAEPARDFNPGRKGRDLL